MNNMRLAGMNNSDLQNKMENDPNAVVMQPVYDNVFDPWPSGKLRSCMDTICECTKTKSLEEVKAVVNNNPDLSEFAKLHPKIYENLLKKEFVNNDSYMKVIYHMLNIQDGVRAGTTSEVEAKTMVSDKALEAVMKK